MAIHRALSYYSALALSRAFQPMAAQLSKKAALPLAKILARASCRSSKTGPRSWMCTGLAHKARESLSNKPQSTVIEAEFLLLFINSVHNVVVQSLHLQGYSTDTEGIIIWINWSTLYVYSFRGDTNMYLYLMSLPHTDMPQVDEILPRVRNKPTYSTSIMGPCVARATSTMILTMLNRNNSVPAW